MLILNKLPLVTLNMLHVACYEAVKVALIKHCL